MLMQIFSKIKNQNEYFAIPQKVNRFLNRKEKMIFTKKINMKFILTQIIMLVFSISLFAESNEPARARNGMVVSASSYASQVGIDILKNGGNAIDAAVATGFALAVTHPSAGNLGGGGFMVIHLNDGKNTTIDFREMAPFASSKNMYLDENENVIENKSTKSMSASGVPGSVEGLLFALQKYGTMSLEEVIQPAIDLASKGFLPDYRLTNFINNYNKEFNSYPSSKKIFTNDGNFLQEDSIIIIEDLAKTLRLIKLNGRDGFYKGEVAEAIVKTSELLNGYITLDDLENYYAVERNPVKGNYRGYEIISMSPPSSGGVAIIEALNILEKFEISKNEWGSSSYIHKLVEILRRVYADRSKHLGDPDFYEVPLENLLSDGYANILFDSIDTLKASRSENIFPGDFIFEESPQTTHYSVYDIFGNAVSTTVTLNSSFGNKIVVDGYGFLMNNEMDDFSIKPGVPNQFGLLGNEANSIDPTKRMLSSMTPTIVMKEDKPFIIIGSPGGSTIITTVLQIIINVIDFEMNIQEAVDAPRIHHQWFPDRIDFERFSFSKDVIINLEKMGHQLGEKTSLGRAQGILIDAKHNLIWGASDPRGFGKAIGY